MATITGTIRTVEAVRVHNPDGTEGKAEKPMSVYHIETEGDVHGRQLSIPLPTGSFTEHDKVKITVAKG
jgi:hypothetical protein